MHQIDYEMKLVTYVVSVWCIDYDNAIVSDGIWPITLSATTAPSYIDKTYATTDRDEIKASTHFTNYLANIHEIVSK